MTATPRIDGYGIVPGQFSEPPARTAPGLGLIIAITAIFGLAGIVPTMVRARRAENSGLPSGRYWKAFGITLAVMTTLSILVGVVATRVINAAASTITADDLARSIVEYGTGADTAPTSASCAPERVDEAGAGTWLCTVDYGADRRSHRLTVDPDGEWVIDADR